MEYIIYKYLNNLTEQNIIDYAKKNNISISFHDAKILLEFTKIHYKELLYTDSKELIKELKDKIDINTYNLATNLFYEYKEKYKDYL